MKKKEASFLLVDGYNIIHSWENLKKLAEESLEHARVELIEILCDYRGLISSEIIIVFDAHKVKGSIGSQTLTNNVYVVYTKEAETADHYIEKTVRTIVHNYNVSVATSDSLEQIIILAEGAVRVSARELYNQVMSAKEKMRKKYMEKGHTKENLLFDNLEPETFKFLENLRLK